MKAFFIAITIFVSINATAQLRDIFQPFGYSYLIDWTTNDFQIVDDYYFVGLRFIDCSLIKKEENKWTYTGANSYFYLKMNKTEMTLKINMIIVKYIDYLKRYDYLIFFKDNNTQAVELWIYEESDRIVLTYAYDGDLDKDQFKSSLRLSNVALKDPIIGY